MHMWKAAGTAVILIEFSPSISFHCNGERVGVLGRVGCLS